MTVVLTVLAILSVLDVISTIRGLKNPNVREANPVIRYLMKFGKLWIAVKLMITAGVIWWTSTSTDHITIMTLWAVNAGYLLVVIRNFKIGKRDK